MVKSLGAMPEDKHKGREELGTQEDMHKEG
jgi:hypothetical protein